MRVWSQSSVGRTYSYLTASRPKNTGATSLPATRLSSRPGPTAANQATASTADAASSSAFGRHDRRREYPRSNRAAHAIQLDIFAMPRSVVGDALIVERPVPVVE